jgi:transposase-like protein
MQRRSFSREFKLEAVKLVGKRGVSSAMRVSTHHQLFGPVFFGWFGIGGF